MARPSARAASKSAARVRFVVPDLDEPRAGAPDDLRDADAAADLDELAARHATRRRARRDRRRARRPPRCCCRRGRPRRRSGRSARPRPRGSAGRVARSSRRARAASGPTAAAAAASIARGRPRRAAEIRVEHHAGRVDRPVASPASVTAGAASAEQPSRSASAGEELHAASPAARRERSRSSATTPPRLRRPPPRDPAGQRAGRRAADGASMLGGRTLGIVRRRRMAGAHGSRTHRATPSAAPLVLKTREPTGTPPLPRHRSQAPPLPSIDRPRRASPSRRT